MVILISCFCSLYLAAFVSAAPAASAVSSVSSARSSVPHPSSTSSAAEATATVPFASTDPNYPLWGLDSGAPEPIRESYGAPIIGPSNIALEQQNPDLLAPPTTDSGSL
jgi:hypothetical protein